MKQILVLAADRDREYDFGPFIVENLREVFENTVEIRLAFLDEIGEIDFKTIDLILMMPHDLIHRVRRDVQDFYDKANIIFPSRTITIEALEQVKQIPANQRVLVFNRFLYSSIETIQLLYQLGVMHLELVPYNPELDTTQFKYIVTQGVTDTKLELAPDAEVIHTGYRRLDNYAFIDIISRLKIDSDRISRNLLRYAGKLPSKHTDVEKWYLTAQMSNKTLTRVMSKTEFGVLVMDQGRNVIYSNHRAEKILGAAIQRSGPFQFPGDQSATERLFQPDFQNELVKIGEEWVLVERHKLSEEDDAMGYYFEFQTAQGIRGMEHKLSEKLRESGLYAQYTFRDIVYRSEEMKKCLTVAQKLAWTDHAILITGESGVGKELMAQSIHNGSRRAGGPFVAVNCAAFPETLLESELFGYEGGAFTGSRRDGKMGLFELADKGSIFLDEVGDMPLALQAKLLRVLQEKKIMRVGSGKVINVDIRVISASNKNLKGEIEGNRFRPDLYYRLSTFRMEIPPLRRRKEDILPLFQLFLNGKGRHLNESETHRLTQYSWPGNVRELQNVAAYYDVIGTLDTLTDDEGSKKLEEPLSNISLQEQILRILRQNPETGLGRQRMLAILRERGFGISEKRFEDLVRELRQEGLISRGRGRAGIRLKKKA